jgi:hypothetical protein
MLTGFHYWEKESDEQITNISGADEGQLNEEQQPEFDQYGTALNEL